MKPRKWNLIGLINWMNDDRYTSISDGPALAPMEKVSVVEESNYEKVLNSLREAQNTIHGEFCGAGHHPQCQVHVDLLIELGEDPSTF